MATLKNTTITGTGHVTSLSSPTASRVAPVTTIIQWTNTGSQSYTVLAGTTPTLSNTTWTCPTGVNNIEMLVVAGGGGGGGSYGGGGGGGGVLYNAVASVTPGTQYTVRVGAGGTAGARNNSSPSNFGGGGGNSIFGNLITNGTFDTDTTGWTSPGTATLSVASGAIQVTNTSTNGRAQSTAFTTVPGRSYIASVTGISRTAANYYFEIRSGVESSDSWTSGKIQRTFVAVQTTTYIELYAIGASGIYAEYDNVSVSETGFTAVGGGGGSAYTGQASIDNSQNGGSGGGAGSVGTGNNLNGGSGTAGQGFPGGSAYQTGGYGAGGGGGAGGAPGPMNVRDVGQGGGIGLNFSISGTPTYYAGGGGGAGYSPSPSSATFGAGGLGGGGRGGTYNPNSDAVAGTASTGGGGGGSTDISAGSAGAGGSGIVIIRYNISSDNTQPESSLRYNSEIRTLELNNVGTSGWTGQNSTRNFGGHNLITYSQTLGSGHTLSNATVASSNNLAPDGTSTASYLVEDTTATTLHEFFVSFATASSTSGTYTYSIYAKAGTRNWIALRLGNSSTSSYSFINLSTGAVGTISGHTNVTATSVGNGWYRCSVTRDTTLGSSSQYAGVRLATGDGTQSYTGQGTSYGVYLWGSQVELGSTAGPYVYTNGVASPVPTSLGGYRTHTYTTTGTSGFTPAHSGLVEVLVVAGGGQGGNITGGGAGGLIYNTAYPVISGKQYAVTVGAGGSTSPGSNAGQNGSNSVFGLLTAIGGGGGAGSGSGYSGFAGGSGGGGGGDNGTNGSAGGAVLTQGNPGGTSLTTGTNFGGGGGGGAGGPGNNAFTTNVAGYGGSGRLIDISGTPTWYAAGGGGGAYIISSTGTRGLGGSGIGGNGGQNGTNATSGTANTGSGGGGNGLNSSGNLQGSPGNGGSGIVIVRYRYD